MEKNWIYIIGSKSPPYKIGFSKNPFKRLCSIQTSHPQKLYIHHTQEVFQDEVRKLEKIIHKTLKFKKSHGEWFHIDLETAILEIQHAIIRYSKH